MTDLVGTIIYCVSLFIGEWLEEFLFECHTAAAVVTLYSN